MQRKTITAVTVEALTLTEVKTHLHLDSGTAEDVFLTAKIKEVRQFCEDYINHFPAPCTLDIYLDSFPLCDRISLKYAPITSITSVKYKDSNGAEYTMTNNTDYIANADTQPAQIVLPYGKTWPVFTPYPVNPVTVRCVVGYDGTTNIIPEYIKTTMLNHIGIEYMYREAQIPEDVMQRIIGMYKFFGGVRV